MSLVISRLKNYRIYEYNSNAPIIFVEADDPDGACFKATHNLFEVSSNNNATKASDLHPSTTVLIVNDKGGNPLKIYFNPDGSISKL